MRKFMFSIKEKNNITLCKGGIDTKISHFWTTCGMLTLYILQYARAPIGNEINQCQFRVSRHLVTGYSIYALKFGAGQKTTSAMALARWQWLDGRPWWYCNYIKHPIRNFMFFGSIYDYFSSITPLFIIFFTIWSFIIWIFLSWEIKGFWST